MRLQRLDLIRLPGFPRGGPLLTNLSPRLNLVVGRNGSGKTSICRAIRGLLSPETLKNARPAEITSRWTDGEADVALSYEDGRIKASPEDHPLARLPLPPHLAHCTTVTLEDLQPNLRAHEALTDEIARQMAGGFDLDEVKRAFQLKRNHSVAEQKALRAGRQKLSALQQAQADLWREEAQLVDLEEKKRQADEAKREVDRLCVALELQDELRNLSAVEQILAEFPNGMANIVGNEAERLRQIRADLQAETENRRTLQEQHEAAAREETTAGLTAPVADEILETNRLRLDELRELDRLLDEQTAQSAGWQGKIEEARRDLNALGAAGDPDAIDLRRLVDFEALFHEANAMRERIDALDGKINLPAAPEPAFPLSELEKGMTTLRRWLQIADPGHWPGLLPRWTIWLGLGLSAAGAGSLAWLISPWILLVLTPSVLFFLAAWKKKRTPESLEKQHLAEEYARLSLPEIEAWERNAVAARLTELSPIWPIAMRYERENEQRRELLAQRARLTELEQALDEKRREAAQALGIAAPRGGLSLALLFERLKAYRRAGDEYRSLLAKQQEAERQRGERFEQLRLFLAPYIEQPPASTLEATAALHDLEKRSDAVARAKRNLSAAEKAARLSEERLARLRIRETKLFADLDLTPDREHELHRRLQLLEDYRKSTAQRNELRARRDKSLAQLADRADLRELGQSAIETALAVARQTAAQYDAYFTRIQDIKHRIAEARRKQDIEETLDEVARAERELAQRREDAFRAMAGAFLMEDVAKQYEVIARPPVVYEADRLFNAFTLGKYSLKMNRVGDEMNQQRALAAINSETGLHVPFEALSHGAQMQLLLAVRLAFAETQPTGGTIPILLDEALNSTDPERFAAVARSLLILSRDEGRQVFYFTCQPGDAEAWHAAAAAHDCDAALIDLDAQTADRQAQARPLAPPPPAPSSLAEPGNLTLEEYARLLNAPGFDPAAPPGEIHPAHLADDPRDLHRWLTLGLRSGGQLLALAEKDESGGYLSATQQSRLRAKMGFFKTLADAWRVGRGRSVDRQALREAGVSESFLDEVADLAAALHGEARAIIAALENKRVKGFRQQQIKKTADFFIENGYWDQRMKPNRQDVYASVLTAAGAAIRGGILHEGEITGWFRQYWPDE